LDCKAVVGCEWRGPNRAARARVGSSSYFIDLSIFEGSTQYGDVSLSLDKTACLSKSRSLTLNGFKFSHQIGGNLGLHSIALDQA
jgi:hypothetical protein